MNMQLVNEITKSQIKTDVPQFKAGDTLKVFVKIQEGNKTRLQMFEGVCIAKKGSGIGETFTVRKISYGVGVERVFPVNSQSSIISKQLRLVKYVELNYITYVDYLVKLLELKKFDKRMGAYPILFSIL